MKSSKRDFKRIDNAGILREVRRITWIGLWINLFLSGLKFFTGIVGHSSVLIADAVHSLSDLVTDIAILIGVRYWGRPADEEHPHGHAKIETLVTLLIGVVLFLVALGLIQRAVVAIPDLLQEEKPLSPAWFTFVVAVFGMIVKEYLYQITARIGVRTKSTATVANAWHHRSDALSSIPAAAAVGACLLLGDQYAFLDPVGAIIVAFMIIYAACKVVRPTFAALLDAGASKTRCLEIAGLIRSFPEVRDLHKLRTRQAGPKGLSVDVHIQVDPMMSLADTHHLSHRIHEKLLDSGDDIIDVFVHIEPG